MASHLLFHTLLCAACQGADRKGLLVGVTEQLLRPARPLGHDWLVRGGGGAALEGYEVGQHSGGEKASW